MEKHELAIHSTNPRILNKLAKDEDYWVRCGVAGNIDTPPKTLTFLSNDLLPGVRCIVAKNNNTPAKTLDLMAKDETMHRYIIENKNAWIKTLRHICLNTNKHYFPVVYYILENIKIKPDSKFVFDIYKYRNEYFNKATFASSSNTPVKILEDLSRSSDRFILIPLAKNPNLPDEILNKLAKHDNYEVRAAVACNLNSSVEILTLLSKDRSLTVKKAVANNKNTPSEILEKFSKYRYKNGDILSIVAKNPNTTPETLDYLYKNAYNHWRNHWRIRRHVAQNPNTSPETLKRMSINESDSYMRKIIKDNPNCSLKNWKYLCALDLIYSLNLKIVL